MNKYFKEFFIFITIASVLALLFGLFYFLYIVTFENYVRSSSGVTFGLMYLIYLLLAIGVGISVIDSEDVKKDIKDKKSE
jgi:nitrate reductase gamma subunit